MYYYVFDLYSAFSTRFTNNQRRFQFIKMRYTHHSIFNVVFLKAIKNPVLCMLPPRALLTVLRRVQLGFETRASLPFFRAMTLQSTTPHIPNVVNIPPKGSKRNSKDFFLLANQPVEVNPLSQYRVKRVENEFPPYELQTLTFHLS